MSGTNDERRLTKWEFLINRVADEVIVLLPMHDRTQANRYAYLAIRGYDEDAETPVENTRNVYRYTSTEFDPLHAEYVAARVSSIIERGVADWDDLNEPKSVELDDIVQSTSIERLAPLIAAAGRVIMSVGYESELSADEYIARLRNSSDNKVLVSSGDLADLLQAMKNEGLVTD